MFIPIRTDYRMTRKPLVNYVLVGVNIAIYFMQYNGASQFNVERIWSLLLLPEDPRLMQFFSSVFLHGGFMHLAGNMLFLWVFGNAVNDRLGNVAYLAFYLAGGVMAGVGYLLFTPNAPVLGASGAISAVTGAYLVLFPRVRVTLLMWFYFITTFEVSSLFFLMFQFIHNLVMASDIIGGGGVAYSAHISGYVFGITVAAVLLATRILPRDAMDLISLLRGAQRRSQYRRMVSHGYEPFLHRQGGADANRSRWVKTRTSQTVDADTPASRELQLRREISGAIARHDVASASGAYLRLVQVAADPVLPLPQQLDVANQLMSDEQYPPAADAYERFIKHYDQYEYIADIYLMLGLLYGRYLQQYDRAEPLLRKAMAGLTDQRKIDLARRELQAVEARRQR